MTTRCAGLRHRDLAARPCLNLLDGPAGPRIGGLYRLEEMQDVLSARGRPQGQEPVVGVRERPPAADGDEAGGAVFGKDHGGNVPARASQHRADSFTSRPRRGDSRARHVCSAAWEAGAAISMYESNQRSWKAVASAIACSS